MITINEFLKEFCTKVRKNESLSYVELMVDNHKVIQYGKHQYYVPEDISMGQFEIIYDFLMNYQI
jgi:hypothetical protein